jgi:TIR domain-containing protein
MIGSWVIDHWPVLGFDVFLSHCAEDRDELVIPVFERLRDLSVLPWIDRHLFPIAVDPLDALRANLLRCRHVIYIVTPKLLKQGRGWCAAERSFAELIQRQFQFAASSLWTFEVPLLFVDPTEVIFRRSVYAPLLPRTQSYAGRFQRGQSRVDWAVATIQALLQQQHAETDRLTDQLTADVDLGHYVDSRSGLRIRLSSHLPIPIPIPVP